MYDNHVSIVGYITHDPELRVTNSGTCLVNFGMAHNRRRKDGEQETSFFPVTAWGTLAQNLAKSLKKGDRVAVQGYLQESVWGEGDDEKRRVEIQADDVATSMRWALVTVDKNGAAEPKQKQVEPADQPF